MDALADELDRARHYCPKYLIKDRKKPIAPTPTTTNSMKYEDSRVNRPFIWLNGVLVTKMTYYRQSIPGRKTKTHWKESAAYKAWGHSPTNWRRRCSNAKCQKQKTDWGENF
jgi:hypothetical protein